MDAEAIKAQAEIEQQKMEYEQELARQKAEKEAMERKEIQNMRAQAEDDVMAAFDDKYNPDTDVVEFYPDMLTFTQYNDETREKQVKERGKVSASPAEGGAAPGAQTSSDIETGNKGEIPKLPDAEKSKEDLKKKKITGQMSDDTESGAEVPPSELEEPEDEDIEPDKEPDTEEDEDELSPESEEGSEDEEPDTDEDEDAGFPKKKLSDFAEKKPVTSPDDKTAEEEKAVAQGNGDPGLQRQRVFKIKPAEHIHGNDYVGQDEVEGDLEQQFGDEDEEVGGKKPPFGKKSQPKATPEESPEDKDEDDSEEEKGEKLKKNKAKDPSIKRFSESGWQGQ
jgi:hypothetical protein